MLKGAIWELLGKFGSQIINFLLQIILAYYLSPTDNGIMTLCVVVVNVAMVFMDLGFRTALIQSKEVSQEQYSTVFYINAALATVLFLICFGISTPMAHYYKLPQISILFKILGLNFIFNGLALVPMSILYKNLHFNKINISSLLVALVAGVLSFVMAFKGFGVWSLVAQSICFNGLLMVVYFWLSGWRPTLIFSFSSIKALWAYGNRMFVTSAMEQIFIRIDSFVIGKCYGPAPLGYYGKAQATDNMVRTVSANSLIGVIFPYIARNQDNKPLLKQLYIRYLNIIMFVSVGISGALYLSAQSLFRFIYTQKWDDSVGLFKIMAIGSFAWPVSALMCNVIAAVGNSKGLLRLEIYKKALFVPIYVFGFLMGFKTFIWLLISGYYVSVFFNAYFTALDTGVSFAVQMRILGTYLITGLAATIITHFVAQMLLPDPALTNNRPGELLYVTLASAIFSSVYLAFTFMLRLSGTELLKVLFNKVKKVAFR